MQLTSTVKNRWMDLGFQLGIPLEKLSVISGGYQSNSFEALRRVYRYWLNEKNESAAKPKELFHLSVLIKEAKLCVKIAEAFIICTPVSALLLYNKTKWVLPVNKSMLELYSLSEMIW